MDEPDRPGPSALILVPRVLLYVSAACALSVVIAVGFALAGKPSPSLPVLAVPPGLVLVGALSWLVLKGADR